VETINDEYVDTVNKELWSKAREKYGSNYSVPKDEISYIGELIRGLHVLGIWQKEGQAKAPESVLRSYSVMEHVIPEVIKRALGKQEIETAESLRPEKREKKWNSFIAWAKLHEAEQFTTEQLVEVCGFSYQTTLEFLKISPYFKKIKKGLYEITNPKTKDK